MLVDKRKKVIIYDQFLHIEAYQFRGIEQSFPAHFHEYYVIGIIEKGQRIMTCQNRKYFIQKGDIVIFNPGDSHSCIPNGQDDLDYKAVNISKNIMQTFINQIANQNELPYFKENVIYDEEIFYYLQKLHESIFCEKTDFEKEEYLFLMLTLLMQRCGEFFVERIDGYKKDIDCICDYLEENYYRHLCLDDICQCVQISQSTLLRVFTQSKGITPYRYLLTIRVNKAKKLLEKGMQPIDVAAEVGFSDQSHFTNCFRQMIGLSPGVYYHIFYNKEG